MTAHKRAELFEAYETTIVSVRHPRLGWTDPALIAVELRSSGVVLTAWNPGFDRPSRAHNEQANERLRIELENAGYQPWPADGSAPDGSFAEPGWIVWGIDLAVAARTAARYGQFALFSYDRSGRRSTVPCTQ